MGLYFAVLMRDFLALKPVPAPYSINSGLTPCPTSYLVQKFGLPRNRLGDDCARMTSRFWSSRMVTEDVGPFRVTGHRCAVALLRDSLAKVKSRDPELFSALGTAGMLCCRRVRGTRSSLSNHGLGLAIDFTVSGSLPRRGDRHVVAGMLDLYSILKEDGWFWGAEFGVDDDMHFEVSAEQVMLWIRSDSF